MVNCIYVQRRIKSSHQMEFISSFVCVCFACVGERGGTYSVADMRMNKIMNMSSIIGVLDRRL